MPALIEGMSTLSYLAWMKRVGCLEDFVSGLHRFVGIGGMGLLDLPLRVVGDRLIVFPIELAGAVPVAGTFEGVLRELGNVELKLLKERSVSRPSSLPKVKAKATHLLVKQRRHPNLIIPNSLKIHTLLGTHSRPTTTQLPTIHRRQELLQHPTSTHSFLNYLVIATELQLVPEVRQPTGVYQLLHGIVLVLHAEVWRRDAEHVRDEVWVELGYAVDDRSAPVVAAQDEMGGLDCLSEVRDEVCVVLEGVVVQILGETLIWSLEVNNLVQTFIVRG